LIAITVPEGGAIFVPVEVYLDESKGSKPERIMCVAGYLFERSQAERLTVEWNAQLERFDLPFFHMVDCAHGSGEFSKLEKPERIELQTELIKIANKYARAGFSSTTLSEKFPALSILHPLQGGLEQTFNSMFCLSGVRRWADVLQYNGPISYFFESGNRPEQAEAGRFMNMICEDPVAREKFRYHSHAFIPKEGNPPVQAADLLAWQSYTDRRHALEAKPRRADYVALLGPNRILSRHWDLEETINQLVDFYEAGALPFKPS